MVGGQTLLVEGEIVPVDVLALEARLAMQKVKRFQSYSALELSDMQGFLSTEPSPTPHSFAYPPDGC